MKTNGIIRIGSVIGLFIAIASCTEKNYKMVTQIDSNGTCYREIYAAGDSAFLSGDYSHNPFLFMITPDWKLAFIDSISSDLTKTNYNVKISKRFQSVAGLPEGLQIDNNVRPLVAPEETLEKHFRWFYTYYSFKGTYGNVSDKLPVAIDQFMDKDEQRCWFQGDFSSFSGMNGMESKDRLDEIEAKFIAWYETVDKEYGDSIQQWEALNDILIEYHLILPGKVLYTNAGWNNRDTLVWKVNALRLFASEDYVLSAESRITHVWAFIVTFLAGILAVFLCVRSLLNALPANSSRRRNRQ